MTLNTNKQQVSFITTYLFLDKLPVKKGETPKFPKGHLTVFSRDSSGDCGVIKARDKHLKAATRLSWLPFLVPQTSWLSVRLALQRRPEQSDLLCWEWREVPNPTRVLLLWSACDSPQRLGAEAAPGLVATQCHTARKERPAYPLHPYFHWH